MAKQVSAIKFVGKLGNLVGQSGIDGQTILREKAASVANPQTKDQMAQRAKIKLAGKVAGMLGEVGQLALKANGFKTTRRGTLVKDLLENIMVVDEVAEMPRRLYLVKNPMAVSLPEDVTVTIDAVNNVISGNIAGLPVGTATAKALLVYDRTTQQWTKTSVLDATSSVAITVDNQVNCDVYFYAEIVLPTTAEGRAKLDNLLGQAPGYKVPINRLDASNYGYSQTLNAGMVNGVKYSDSIAANPDAVISSILTTMGEGMSSAITIGLNAAAAANNTSTLQEFINRNYEYVDPTETELNRVQYDEIEVSSGDLTGVALGEANFATPLTVTVPIDDSYSDERFNRDDDQVFIVVYSKTNNRGILSAGKDRISESVEVMVPSYWQGHYVEVWAFVQSAEDPTHVSDTIYCGSGRIA